VQYFDATEVIGRTVLVQQLFRLTNYDVEEVLRVATDQQTTVEVQLNNKELTRAYMYFYHYCVPFLARGSWPECVATLPRDSNTATDPNFAVRQSA
jgi:hypothetical protein